MVLLLYIFLALLISTQGVIAKEVYFNCESSNGNNLNVNAVATILQMSGYRVENLGKFVKMEKYTKYMQKPMFMGMFVNTGGHYVAIVKGIPGKDNYTFIDSMNISNLPTFKTEESLLQHLISRNYSNYLFV